MPHGDEVLAQVFQNFIRPAPIFTVSEWADKYRQLSQRASAEPGKWSTSRTPYLREIMDCLSAHSPIQTVVVLKGAQIGGSECGNNWIGYVMDYCPGPTLVVQPTVDLAKKYSRQRIEPLINDSPRLALKVKKQKSRDAGNTMLSKEFPGGILIMTGANSAVGLRSLPARNLFLDEVDGYPEDVDGEGDPVSLAEARTRTFAARKIFKNSTPTVEARSRIKSAYENSDQRRYHVPCPHCDVFQIIEWKRIIWPKGEPNKATMTCEGCGVQIEEYHKTQMLERGKWIADNPQYPNKKVAGFQISSLYSPLGWFSWGDAAELFEEAKKNPLKLRSFVNTVLGETWKEKGDAPDWKRLYERREPYEFNKVPIGGLFITAGADVQKDRIEVEIVAWGRDKQSWSIDYRVFQGDTTTDLPWNELDKLLNEHWPIAFREDILMPIRMLAVDSGYNTQQVYNWVRKYPLSRVIATKGSSTAQSIIGIPSAVDISTRGDKIRRGAKVWPLGVNMAKSELYAWLNLDKPTNEIEPFAPGYCHFPQYDEGFFKMLTAEQIMVRMVKGYRRFEWEKIRERNEALDCRVMARAAASVVGLDRFKPENWAELEAIYSKESEEGAKNAGTQTKKGEIARRPSNFL